MSHLLPILNSKADSRARCPFSAARIHENEDVAAPAPDDANQENQTIPHGSELVIAAGRLISRGYVNW